MSTDSARLHPDDLEQLATLVAEKVVARMADSAAAPAPRWLTAGQVAERLGVSRATVYERSDELGAVRIGSGPRGRLRFDAAIVDEALTARHGGRASHASEPPAGRASRRRARPTAPGGVPLLPIRGADV